MAEEYAGVNDRVIRALEIDGELTVDQAKRVKRAVASGKTLEEALRGEPLVEPLQLMRARHRSGFQTNEAIPIPKFEHEAAAPPQMRPAEQTESLPAAGELPTFDLAQNGEIPLVDELYALLGEVIEMNGRGAVLEGGPDGVSFVSLYLSSGKLASRRVLKEWRGEKMLAHLKVMARLESWRGGTVRGAVVLQATGIPPAKLLIELTERPGGGEWAHVWAVK